MSRPECLFGERVGTQPVLVGNHHPFKVEFFANKGEIPKDLGYKLQLFEAVELIVDRRLDNQRAVTVDKESAFLFHILAE